MADSEGSVTEMLKAHLLAREIKSVAGRIWKHLPAGLQERPPISSVNHWIHKASRKFSARRQSDLTRCPLTTRFMRYPPLLLMIRELISELPFNDTIRLCVMGCSTGAELYSIIWAIQKARKDLRVLAIGVDISEVAIKKAKGGRYGTKDLEVRGLSVQQLGELFDITEQEVKVKDSIATGIQWVVADVRDSRLQAQLGLQDIIVANNFLVFMRENEATGCFRKIIKFVRPGGLLFCRGVDLDVRERVAQEYRLEPIPFRIEELHDINGRERRGWPWDYWGLEPLDKGRKDWVRRYATAFRMPGGDRALEVTDSCVPGPTGDVEARVG
jgi:chemotaxis methyl-accepting protein methylase